ncbi:transposase [Roseateles sp. LKC17W]|uniref:Transposase n=1 Tax=Pelomonas margarita TaxID=3299031 RepID=A0ABW7FQL6_9BURK
MTRGQHGSLCLCCEGLAPFAPCRSPGAPDRKLSRLKVRSAPTIGDLIQFKGSRGNPVHPLQTKMNRAIATLRYKVEQGFGTMKRRFHLSRARYFGVSKTQAQMVWAALGVNLLKAMRKLQSAQLQPCPGSSPS